MKRRALPLLFLFSLTVAVLSPFVGAINVPFSALFDDPASGAARVLWELRIPRVLLGWITGSTLAVCGLMFQALFHNPLASPDMLGVSSGAALGAVLSIRFGLAVSLWGISGLSLASFAGALFATFAIYLAGFVKRGGLSESTLLLAGIAMSFLFGSATMIVQYSGGSSHTFRMMRWSMGGIQTVGFSSVWGTLPALVVVMVTALVSSRELDLLVCGEEIAAGRGVAVARLRKLLFVMVSLAVGVNVATCGPIAFVGLMAPHICRKIIGEEHRPLTLASSFFGGAFLVLCDTVARTLWAPEEVPVGILTSCAGSVFFLWLLLRERRG